ncbi:beta galactosidase jelly roll domain-containing protein [candidate division KSB1 bacterium]|nr:beta galactosidase jelly roll domain-containing protein [candidate division KSB1 bacterium]
MLKNFLLMTLVLFIFYACDQGEKMLRLKLTDWALQTDSLGIGETNNWADINYEFSDSIQIRRLTNLDTLLDREYTGTVWYFTEFDLDQVQNVALAIDTIYQSGLIWVNGKFTGEQKGAIKEKFDITDKILSGKNRITVKVIKNKSPGGILGEVTIQNFKNEIELHKGEYAMFKSPEPPGWVKNAVIYEVNVRQFTREGTFDAFARHLREIEELGVDIIWFMPIHPIGVKNRKGTLGSYYSIYDYYGINPEFGDLDDFRTVVKKIHELGMYVIIDLVINHTAWDNPLIKEHPEWYTHNKKGHIISPPFADWWDVAELNYDNKELRRYMTDMMIHWIKDIGIDGYRCDVAERVSGEFWKDAISELQTVKPTFMLAEGEAPALHSYGFHMTYATKMYRLFNSIAAGKKDPVEIDEYLAREDYSYPEGALRMRFTSNHDENSFRGSAIERMTPDGAKAFAVLIYTLPGTPLIYNGQETGITKRLEFYDKDEIEWQNSEFRPFYRTLNYFYKNHPALYSGHMHRFNTQKLYAFSRELEGDQIFTILNLTPETQNETIYFENISGTFREIFKQTTITINNSELYMELAPWEYRVYEKTQ